MKVNSHFTERAVAAADCTEMHPELLERCFPPSEDKISVLHSFLADNIHMANSFPEMLHVQERFSFVCQTDPRAAYIMMLPVSSCHPGQLSFLCFPPRGGQRSQGFTLLSS